MSDLLDVEPLLAHRFKKSIRLAPLLDGTPRSEALDGGSRPEDHPLRRRVLCQRTACKLPPVAPQPSRSRQHSDVENNPFEGSIVPFPPRCGDRLGGAVPRPLLPPSPVVPGSAKLAMSVYCAPVVPGFRVNPHPQRSVSPVKSVYRALAEKLAVSPTHCHGCKPLALALAPLPPPWAPVSPSPRSGLRMAGGWNASTMAVVGSNSKHTCRSIFTHGPNDSAVEFAVRMLVRAQVEDYVLEIDMEENDDTMDVVDLDEVDLDVIDLDAMY